MWTIVYMSKSEEDVTSLRNSLRENGIISTLRKREDFFEILVPSREVSLAHKAIINIEIK